LGKYECHDDMGSPLIPIAFKTLGQFNIFLIRIITFRWKAVSTLKICNYSCKEGTLGTHIPVELKKKMSLYGGSQFDSKPSHLLRQVNARPEYNTCSEKKNGKLL